jgi:hypothetical protein
MKYSALTGPVRAPSTSPAGPQRPCWMATTIRAWSATIVLNSSGFEIGTLPTAIMNTTRRPLLVSA